MAAPKNPLGAKSDKIWRDAVMRAVRRNDPEDGKPKLEKLADSLVKKALDGDCVALREIGDRLDGKATQAVEHSGSITLGSLIEALWQAKQPAPRDDKSVH